MSQTVADAILADRAEQMALLLPWCTAEPCVHIPLNKILTIKNEGLAFITHKDLAAAFLDPTADAATTDAISFQSPLK